MKTAQAENRPEVAKTTLSTLFTFHQQTLSRITGLIQLAFGILEGLIGLRFLLMMIASNPAAPFANFVYAITYPFLYPFIGLTQVFQAQGMVIEWYDLVAMIVYGLVAWVVIRLTWLIFAQVRS
jgi:TctA family transporter